MQIKSPRRRGISLIEVLLGVVIFALAMLPLLALSQSSTKDTYSMSKHLIASQVATSIIERIISMPFSEVSNPATFRDVKDLPIVPENSNENDIPSKLISHKNLEEMLKGMDPNPSQGQSGEKWVSMKDGIVKALKSFTYSVKVDEPNNSEEANKMVLVGVTVRWTGDESEKGAIRELSRWCIKFNDRK